MSLLFYPDKNSNSYVVLDKSFYTFRAVDKYFWMGSTRGDANISFAYPVEDGRVVHDFKTYSNVQQVPGFAENYDENKEILIFLHGFNVNTQQAFIWNRVIFKRLYWSGYRNNFLGITWEGNWGFPSEVYFDTNVYGALQTSRAIKQFLGTLPDVKISIMAHSLGNLVMWNALRLHKISGGKAISNAINVEGAVLEEAFYPQSSIEYTKNTDPEHVITYTEDQLKRHSWAFWFKQSSHKATDVVENFVNSKTGKDEALIIMKNWHASSTKEYDRDNSAAYRTPESHSLPEYIALMKISCRRPQGLLESASEYSQNLTDPIGLTDVDGSNNCDATQFGWRNNEHSDMKDRAFYFIHKWFKVIFETKTEIIK